LYIADAEHGNMSGKQLPVGWQLSRREETEAAASGVIRRWSYNRSYSTQ